MKRSERWVALGFAVLCGAVSAAGAADYSDDNYPDRRAMVADVCPSLKVTRFTFGNGLMPRTYSRCFRTSYAWENAGQKDIIAFEVVVLKYDPFNRPMIGSRASFPGHNSANYKPLKPGEKDDDGGTSYGAEDTFTAICYVRHVRFADGSVWTADPSAIIQAIKKLNPEIKDPGPLEPRPKKDEKGGDESARAS